MAKTLAAIASEPDIILHRQFTMEFLLVIRIKVTSKRLIRAIYDGLVIFSPVSGLIRLRVRDGVNTDFFGFRFSPKERVEKIVCQPAWVLAGSRPQYLQIYVCLSWQHDWPDRDSMRVIRNPAGDWSESAVSAVGCGGAAERLNPVAASLSTSPNGTRSSVAA
jgi:hypothetical protein